MRLENKHPEHNTFTLGLLRRQNLFQFLFTAVPQSQRLQLVCLITQSESTLQVLFGGRAANLFKEWFEKLRKSK